MIFLHGMVASPGNFLAPIEALLARGVPVRAPAYGHRGTARIEECLDELIGPLSVIVQQCGQIDIVGHSLGGLLGLKLAHRLGDGAVRTLVGLGTPWRGIPEPTGVPRLAAKMLRRPVGWTVGRTVGRSMVDLMGPELRAMPPIPEGLNVVAVVSPGDTVVPVLSADPTLATRDLIEGYEPPAEPIIHVEGNEMRRVPQDLSPRDCQGVQVAYLDQPVPHAQLPAQTRAILEALGRG